MTRDEAAELWEIEAVLRELTRRVIELSKALQHAEGKVARKKPRLGPPKPCNRAGVPRPRMKRSSKPVPRIEQPPKPVWDFRGEEIGLGRDGS